MFYLTNPATKIILPGETEPLLLGEQAAHMIKFLATVKGLKPDTDSIRQQLESEILAKLKKPGSYVPLDAIPSAKDSQPVIPGKILSDAEYAKLSPAEQEAYLSGAM